MVETAPASAFIVSQTEVLLQNQALVKLDALFRQMYAEDCRGGRPSIAPEKLLRAMMLQLLYSVRSERQSRCNTQGNTGSELRFMRHTLSDNRHGLIVNVQVTQTDGFAEREAAKAMIADALQAAPEGATVAIGADKGYDAQEFTETAESCSTYRAEQSCQGGSVFCVGDDLL